MRNWLVTMLKQFSNTISLYKEILLYLSGDRPDHRLQTIRLEDVSSSCQTNLQKKKINIYVHHELKRLNTKYNQAHVLFLYG